MAEQELHNLCTQENGVQVAHVTSQLPNCPATSILVNERKVLWMSQAGLPQSITLDLTNMRERPKLIKCFGFDCWHDYQSNPSVIELLVSNDAQNYINWITIYPELRQGIQLFQIDPLGRKYTYLKIVIRETFGASKTYLNQIFLLEEHIPMTTESMSESQQQTEKSNYNRQQEFEHHQFIKQPELPKPTFERQLKQQYQTDDLQEKIHRMDQEVVMLKQSSAGNLDPQKRNYLGMDELVQVQQGFPMLTSTEKEVQKLKDEINSWKQRFEQLRQVVERIQSQPQLQQQQQPQTVQTPKPPKPQSNEQIEAMIEKKVNERIYEVETKFQIQLQMQEQKFKEQQLELVNKLRSMINKDEKRRRDESVKHRNRKSPETKKSNSLRRKKQSESESDTSEKENNYNNNNRKKSTSQRRVADLLTQLQAKLQMRARKVEELNNSSTKKKRHSFQDSYRRRRLSSSSDSNSSDL